MNVVHITRGGDGQYYLSLVSANGERLAHSEGYRTFWNAKRAAHKNFPEIKILDLVHRRSW